MEKVLKIMEGFATMQQQEDSEVDYSTSKYNFRTTVDPYASVIHLWISSSDYNVAALRALRVISWMERNPQVIEESPIQQRLIQYNKVLKGLMRSEQNTYIAVRLLESMYSKAFFQLPKSDEKTIIAEDTTELLLEEFQFAVSIKPDAKSFATVIEPLLQLSNDDDLLVTIIRKAKELDLLNGFLLRKIKKVLNDEKELELLLHLCQSSK